MAESIDDEEEEILFYMDFNSKVEDDLFTTDKEFKIIGVETNEPILQLGNQVFRGEWKDTMGTHVFFEEDSVPQNFDPLFPHPPSTFSYKCKTNKVLHMSRIFVNPKSKVTNPTVEGDSEVNDNDIPDSSEKAS